MKNKVINIPKPLWKLHGKQAYKQDLIMTYLIAVIVMLVNLKTGNGLVLWKVIVVAILSIDIGGGVVSNFTRGTINYYQESKLSPHLFVWFHLLQTFALALIYTDSSFPISLTMITAMIGASVAIVFHKTVMQRQISVFFFALVALMLSLFPEIPIPANTLTLLMSFKLLVGFSSHYGKYATTLIENT
ncbi:hypothetical protein GCM10007415_34260 [Parapedobacter pyrenivorans]|uniref:Uncharacterized protein n=1 Tax=Parapedobacter pyrenivorans TaxID=1305674 RepID=A0A917HYC3_9SPHI|nr:hypothetical protein [Parapedobacter pyrenivorans]GGG96181.1 hypothetical protein GCM10007415_34260 [Parapedobacter pyrenivorans]